MTLFNISKEEAKEIRENLYRDCYPEKPIKFDKVKDTVDGRTVHGYTFNEKDNLVC